MGSISREPEASEHTGRGSKRSLFRPFCGRSARTSKPTTPGRRVEAPDPAEVDEDRSRHQAKAALQEAASSVAAREESPQVDQEWVVLKASDAAGAPKDEAQKRSSSEAATSAPEEEAQETSSSQAALVPSWDTKHRDAPRKHGAAGAAEAAGMVVPTLLRIAANLVGSTVVAGGYAISKASTAVGLSDSPADSAAFHASLRAWMFANGIVPSVTYEPTRAVDKDAIAKWYGAPRQADDEICQTPLLLANHVCYLDGAVLATCFKAPKVVAMNGTRKVPVVGKFMEDMGTIFVDRSNPDSRNATLEAIQGHCDGWKPGHRPLLIFPEGTTTNGKTLKEFRKGAFVPGVPVRPVILVYTGHWDPATTTYEAGPDGLEKTTDEQWCKDFFGTFIHSLDVVVLPPIVPNAAERDDPELYARNCHSIMAAELERLQAEQKLQADTWKKRVDRKDGGEGYKFGDVTRLTLKKTGEAWRTIFGIRAEADAEETSI